MAEYIYSGPLSGLSLRGADGARSDVALTPGATVDLPADNPAVTALVHRGHLTAVPPPVPATLSRKAASKPEDKKETD